MRVLRECPTAQSVWQALRVPTSWRASFHIPIKEWIQTNCEGYEVHDHNVPWSIVFSYTIWLLWKRRNRVAFEGGQHNGLILYKLSSKRNRVLCPAASKKSSGRSPQTEL